MIVLDTSAIPAILLEEVAAASFRDRINEAGGAMVSAGNAVELAVVADSRGAALSRRYGNSWTSLSSPSSRWTWSKPP